MKIDIEVLNDIIQHRAEVQSLLSEIRSHLEKRGLEHDLSKLGEFEFDAFVKTRPKFKNADFGTKEYQECVDEIQPAIDHHYQNNRHHTGYYENGFSDMSLLDILEMLADWKSAANRNKNLTFEQSLPIAFEKYNIPENMQKHILKTLKDLGWI